MGVATAIAASAVVGGAVSAYGADKAAGAAGDAASAQLAASEAWQNRTLEQRQQALEAYDKYSPTQASTIEKSLNTQERNVQRQETLVKSIDPALIEAGSQMNKLLQGQAAPVLDNLKGQRQTQRQGLLDTLRQQYGPGAETSQAGINALQKFDAETSNVLSNAQQSYLNQVSNIALGGAQTLGASLGAEADRFAKLGEAYGNIGVTKANIMTGANSGTNQAAQSTVQSAGASGVPGVLSGQMWSGIGNSVAQIGGTLAQSLGKPSAAPGPTPTPTTGAGTYNMGNSGYLGGDVSRIA